MPRDNAAAITWMVNRLAEKARAAKRRITNRWQWRKLDHERFYARALATGLQREVCEELGWL